MAGLKFVRQQPIEEFIADFACRECNLIVELDGASHDSRGEYDIRRQQRLESLGYRVLRIGNDDVLSDPEAVCEAVVLAAGLDLARWRNGEYGRRREDV